jgi:hypothetical protein
LHEGILQAIRGLLPVKNILKDYLAEPDAGDDGDEDEEVESKEEKTGKESEKEEVVATKEPEKEEEVASTKEAEKEPVVATKEPEKEPVVATKEPEKESEKIDHVVPEEPRRPQLIIKEDPVLPLPEKKEEPSTPTLPPTVIVQTEPSVQFTNFDQVIQQQGGTTRIGYVEKDRSKDESERINMLDEDGEELNEFDDLTQAELLPLELGDFEVLP